MKCFQEQPGPLPRGPRGRSHEALARPGSAWHRRPGEGREVACAVTGPAPFRFRCPRPALGGRPRKLPGALCQAPHVYASLSQPFPHTTHPDGEASRPSPGERRQHFTLRGARGLTGLGGGACVRGGARWAGIRGTARRTHVKERQKSGPLGAGKCPLVWRVSGAPPDVRLTGLAPVRPASQRLL